MCDTLNLALKTNYLILFVILLSTFSVSATHNRAGAITYRHISGNIYEFTVKTCTKSSVEADRSELEVEWGDGTRDTVGRNSVEELDFDVQINTYIGRHEYTGPGTYIISVEDPNRNSNIININSSVNVEFCIQSELIISPFIGSPNNSPVIQECPCPEFACLNETYCYNISAFDQDGDSLAYSIVPCRGEDCIELSIPQVYEYPDDAGGGILTIDSITGTLCWANPEFQGEYNVAVKVSEYRNGIYIGCIMQDMQISVQACSNKSPVIVEKADTCIFIDQQVTISFTAADSGDNIDLYATGQLVSLANNPASFQPQNGNDLVAGSLVWAPTCSQVSLSDYSVIIHANDNNETARLTDILDYRIKVNLPPVINVVANPIGGNMSIAWTPYNEAFGCQGLSYNIYRSTDSTDAQINCCEKSDILAMGYELVGNTLDTSFLDENILSVGNKYCYLVTAILPNGAESCASNQSCGRLKFEIPVLTNVSVEVTDTEIGKDSIYWSWPKEIDTVNFPGPYFYELYRNNNFSINTNTLIHTTSTQSDISLADTFYLDENIDTENQAYTYQVALYSNNTLVGNSVPASSILLSSVPNDNQLTLNWTESVPWLNEYYRIYREIPLGSGNFALIDSTNNQTYTDTGLVNLTTYCYKVQSVGNYSEDGIRTPLLNWSQEHCNAPFDFTPPCPPTAFISGNCDLEETYISWTNPNNSCADDVVQYRLYFAPFEGDSLEFLTEINADLDTFYTHKDRGSIAGCYYVTAVDSLPYANESVPSNVVCIDNCEGFYTLPNIFTPNGNSVNDIYHPILPYKFVESVEMNIFNRYGTLVYNTTDPFINWDGTFLNSGTLVSDGVYFYVCKVNLIKLAGIITEELSGNITVLKKR